MPLRLLRTGHPVCRGSILLCLRCLVLPVPSWDMPVPYSLPNDLRRLPCFYALMTSCFQQSPSLHEIGSVLCSVHGGQGWPLTAAVTAMRAVRRHTWLDAQDPRRSIEAKAWARYSNLRLNATISAQGMALVLSHDVLKMQPRVLQYTGKHQSNACMAAKRALYPTMQCTLSKGKSEGRGSGVQVTRQNASRSDACVRRDNPLHRSNF